MGVDQSPPAESNNNSNREGTDKLALQEEIFAELKEAMNESETLRLKEGTQIHLSRSKTELLGATTEVLIDPSKSVIEFGGDQYVAVYVKESDGTRGPRLGAVLLHDVQNLDSERYGESLVGKTIQVVGESVTARKPGWSQELTPDFMADKDFRVTRYFREVKEDHYVELEYQVHGSNEWNILGFVPAKNITEQTEELPREGQEGIAPVQIPERPPSSSTEEQETASDPNSQAYGESLVGEEIVLSGNNVVARKPGWSKELTPTYTQGKAFRVTRYFREIKGIHYVELEEKVSGTSQWSVLGFVPAQNLEVKSAAVVQLPTMPAAPDPRPEIPPREPITTPDPPDTYPRPEGQTEPREQIAPEIEGLSESFLQSFKESYRVPLDFGILLKGVSPVKLREIAQSGMDNFFLVHDGVLREIAWNGSDYVYAGTRERALIHNGDMVYESRAEYEADQNRMEQKTLRNEEPKYADYPLNGLIYMPTLEVNGVTVMRFQPGTRTKYINASIYHSLKALAIEFYQKTKKPLVVSSVYRTHSHQQELFDQYGSGRAARPGNSKHNIGIAVDIAAQSRGHFSSSSAFDTFAAQFGFDRPTWEEWHFEHVQSKAVRANSGVSRTHISVMLDDIPRQQKREEFIVQCINPTLQQAIVDGMTADSASYRNLYHNLYKLLEKPENMQLSVTQFDELCTLERQRQHTLDGRGVLPRIFSRPQRTLAFDTNDIPRSKRDQVIISDNFVAIKHPVGSNEYLRDFIGIEHEIIQIIDNNGRLFDLKWNPAGLGGTGTYEYNGRHFSIDGGETILLYPIDRDKMPNFSFRDGEMSRREILLENAEWFEYQINRLNEKWKEWYNDQPLLSRASRFRPLTMYDVCGLLSSESTTRFSHRTGSHSNGEKGMLPLPVNHEDWVGPVGGNPLNDKSRTPRVEENILGMLEYMLALKHVSLAYSGGKTKYHKIINRFDNNPKKEAAYILAVMHARGTSKSVIENIDEDECSIGYTFGSRQSNVTAGFEIAEEIVHTLGEEELVREPVAPPTPQYNSDSMAQATDTVRNALSVIPGRHQVERFPSNQNREVAIIVPQATDMTRPVEVVYYFHGLRSSIDRTLNGSEGQGLGPIINEIGNSNRNVVFVVPDGPGDANHYQWMNPLYGMDMVRLQQDTEQRIGAPIASRTIIGHSAGGQTIMNGAQNGMQADKIVFFDGSYIFNNAGDLAGKTYAAMQQRGEDFDMEIVYKPGTATERSALSLANQSNVTTISTGERHGEIPGAYLALALESRTSLQPPNPSPETHTRNIAAHFESGYIGEPLPDGSVVLNDNVKTGELVGSSWDNASYRGQTHFNTVCKPSIGEFWLPGRGRVYWVNSLRNDANIHMPGGGFVNDGAVVKFLEAGTRIYPTQEACERAQQIRHQEALARRNRA